MTMRSINRCVRELAMVADLVVDLVVADLVVDLVVADLVVPWVLLPTHHISSPRMWQEDAA